MTTHCHGLRLLPESQFEFPLLETLQATCTDDVYVRRTDFRACLSGDHLTDLTSDFLFRQASRVVVTGFLGPGVFTRLAAKPNQTSRLLLLLLTVRSGFWWSGIGCFDFLSTSDSWLDDS